MDEMDQKEKLFDALRGVASVMLGTRSEQGSLHARPMAIADIDPAGVLWFVTSDDSAKAEEIRHEQRGVVTAQDERLYVSVTGRFDLVHDRERVHALWKPTWNVWFPDGEDDESLVLVRFEPEIGEYWDNKGIKGLRYVFEAARAFMNGDRPATDQGQHAKVPLR